MKILFAHMLNNYTGSPRVLANILERITLEENVEIHLLTSNGKGCISDIPKINYHNNYYFWSSNKITQVFVFLFSQLYQFIWVLFKKFDCVYINTVIPFSVAVAAKLKRIRVIYHIHEYYDDPNLLHRLYLKVIEKCSTQIIVVSHYLMKCYPKISQGKMTVILNSIPSAFYCRIKDYSLDSVIIKKRFVDRKIIMPCSLKLYKGVLNFLELARLLPEFSFTLVISNTQTESEVFFHNIDIPKNLHFLFQVEDMIEVYLDASLVMNLSLPELPNKWIETFGMTIIEGFSCGLPVFAPKYGGPKELIINDVNGYLIEPKDLQSIKQLLITLFNDYSLYTKISNNAILARQNYLPDKNYAEIQSIIMKNGK